MELYTSIPFLTLYIVSRDILLPYKVLKQFQCEARLVDLLNA